MNDIEIAHEILEGYATMAIAKVVKREADEHARNWIDDNFESEGHRVGLREFYEVAKRRLKDDGTERSA